MRSGKFIGLLVCLVIGIWSLGFVISGCGQGAVTPTLDTTAPTFTGLGSATVKSTAEVTLSWSAASDDVTSAANINYLIFYATSEALVGNKLTSNDYAKTVKGTTSAAITALEISASGTSTEVGSLTSGTAYYFAVRASDEAGNIDSNTVKKQATTEAAPTFNGLISATAISSSEVTLTWEAATDLHTSASSINYLIFHASTEAQLNSKLSSNTFTKLVSGVTSTSVTSLNSGTTYYFAARASDEAGNIDSNSVKKQATTEAAPTFNGLISATALSSYEVLLTWEAASDLHTSASSLNYLIFHASTEAQLNSKLGSNTITKIITGVTSTSVTGLFASTTYYFAARASDEAGNIDTNIATKGATTLPAGWVLVASNTTNNLYGIYTAWTGQIPSDASWIVGANGTILKSSDYGVSWTAQNSGTTADLYSTVAADTSTALAFGDSTAYLRTNDGGTTWTDMGNLPFSVLSLTSTSNTTYAVDSSGNLRKNILNDLTVAGNWNNVPGAGSNLRGVSVTLGDDDKVCVVGANGYMSVSNDGGDNWTPITTNTSQNLNGVIYIVAGGTTIIEAVGNQGTFIVSTDGGTSWTTMSSNLDVNFHNIYWLKEVGGVTTMGIVGSNGRIYRFDL